MDKGIMATDGIESLPGSPNCAEMSRNAILLRKTKFDLKKPRLIEGYSFEWALRRTSRSFSYMCPFKSEILTKQKG